MRVNRTLAALATAASVLGLAGAAHAVVFQSVFQGATFTVTPVSPTEFTFDIAGGNALSGDWAGAAALDAFAFNGNILSGTPTGMSVNGVTTDLVAGGLDSKGCDGKGFSSGFCFDLDPPPGVAADMSFDIKVTGTTFNFSPTNAPDLKIDWSSTTTDADTAGVPDVDTHLGSLYSETISVAVPEPATWALMLIGIGGLGAAMRMSRRNAMATA